MAMSESKQFREYAAETLLWVAQSKTEEEKQLLLELVRTWTEAAVVGEFIPVVVGSHLESRAP
jgi:hypothetical protein